MNIFIISRGYPSKQDPTWGCFEKDQAEALHKLGHQIVILAVDTRFRFYWRALGIQHARVNGISIYNIFLLPEALLFFLPRSVRDCFFAWQLDKVYQRATEHYGTPDILYSHYLRCTQFAIHLKKKYSIPLVGIEHWSALNIRPIPKQIRYMVDCTYPYVNQLIAVSEPLKQSIMEFNIDTPISVVHNMVGKEFYYSSSTTSNSLTFVSTGRLIYGKGFDLLINALHETREQLPSNWQTIIIGSGKFKNTLQKLINSYDLQQHIHLVGQKNKLEVMQILQHSDIFILPSRGENFSVAVLEALACGMPVIASICGGIRECIDSKNGLLFPVNDTYALAKSIQKMVKDINKYDRKAIAEDCQARFSSEVIAKQLIQIFEDTIKKHKEEQ